MSGMMSITAYISILFMASFSSCWGHLIPPRVTKAVANSSMDRYDDVIVLKYKPEHHDVSECVRDWLQAEPNLENDTKDESFGGFSKKRVALREFENLVMRTNYLYRNDKAQEFRNAEETSRYVRLLHSWIPIRSRLNTTAFAETLSWYHRRVLPKTLRDRRSLMLISTQVLKKCEFFLRQKFGLRQWLESIRDPSFSVYLFSQMSLKPADHSYDLQDKVEYDPGSVIYYLTCSDLHLVQEVPWPDNIDRLVVITLDNLLYKSSFPHRVIDVGSFAPLVRTFRAYQKEASFVPRVYEDLSLHHLETHKLYNKAIWGQFSDGEFLDGNRMVSPQNRRICLRCAAGCRRSQEKLIMEFLEKGYNVTFDDYIRKNCKPSLYLGEFLKNPTSWHIACAESVILVYNSLCNSYDSCRLLGHAPG